MPTSPARWRRTRPPRSSRLRTEWQLGDAAVKELKFSDTFDWPGGTWSLRMTYVHLIGEYARHNGHADLLREAIDGVRAR